MIFCSARPGGAQTAQRRPNAGGETVPQASAAPGILSRSLQTVFGRSQIPGRRAQIVRKNLRSTATHLRILAANYDEIAANLRKIKAGLREIETSLHGIAANLNAPGGNLIQFRPKSHILRVSPSPQPRPKQPGVVCRKRPR